MALFGDKTQVFVVNYPLDILMIIKSQRVKRALVAALADEEMIKIMNCVMNHSKSFIDITRENNDIPHTTAFRKIKWLLNEGLLIVDKIVITDAGKKFSYTTLH